MVGRERLNSSRSIGVYGLRMGLEIRGNWHTWPSSIASLTGAKHRKTGNVMREGRPRWVGRCVGSSRHKKAHR